MRGQIDVLLPDRLILVHAERRFDCIGAEHEEQAMRDREYRAVLLTVDEAVELNKAAGNRVTRPCCPHLDVFHSSGKTTHGKSWRFCNIQGCSCHEETGHALSYCRTAITACTTSVRSGSGTENA